MTGKVAGMLPRRLRAVCESPEIRYAAGPSCMVPTRQRRRAVMSSSDSEPEVETSLHVLTKAKQPVSLSASQATSVPLAGTTPSVHPGGRDVLASSANSGGHMGVLLDMGFTPGTAKSALNFSNGDLSAAIDICLGSRRFATVDIAMPPHQTNQHRTERMLAATKDVAVPSRQPMQHRTERMMAGTMDVAEPPPRQEHHAERMPTVYSQPSQSARRGLKRGITRKQRSSQKRKRRRGGSSGSDDISLASDGDSSGTGEQASDIPTSQQTEQDMSESDSSNNFSGGSARRPHMGTKALRELSASAQAVLLDSLSGPRDAEEPESAIRRRQVDVRQSISSGCTKLKTNYWQYSDELVARSACYKQLKAHQCVGVRWLLALHPVVPGMILADEMGLGKTLTTLCFLEILASKKPSLIVAPASLLENWESEAAKWTPKMRTLKYHTGSGTGQGRSEIREEFFQNPRKYKLVITTPNVFNCKTDRSAFFRKIDFEYLICDEAHGLKNSGTARYREISKTVMSSHRLLLTGTPVQNSLAELATLLGFALSAEKKKQVTAELQEISEEPHDTALRQLQTAAAPLILRRLKADVLTELPAKRGIVVYCDMQGVQRELYDKELAACRKGGTFTNARVREAFFQLRRICLHPLMGKHRLSKEQDSKLVEELCRVRPDFARAGWERARKEVQTWSDFDKHDAAVAHGLSSEFRVSKDELLGSAKVLELLRILRENSSRDGKTLVFSQFTQLLDVVQAALAAAGIDFYRLDGKTAIQDRHSLVAGFQGDGGPRVFLISTKAGGVGLNLTAANTVIMLDLDFNPQNSRQAEDRVHRLGQSREVTIYYLICRGSVEDMVLRRNVDKMQLDRQFGARRTAMEAAMDEANGPQDRDSKQDMCAEFEGADAEAHAKVVEKRVMQEFHELLKRPEAQP